MARILVVSADLPVGEPLRWPVYDRAGRMLLQRGMRISAEQREALLQRGLYRDTDVETDGSYSGAGGPDLASPFQRFSALVQRLSRAFDAIHAASPDTPQRIERLVADLQTLCTEYPDAMLAVVHLEHSYDYNVGHPIRCAVLCAMMAVTLEYEPQRTQSLLAAALTQNVGMLALQATLQKQPGQLSEEQRAAVREHPRKSVEMLRAAGVSDELWLRTVLQHHERISGEGYPAGLSGEAAIEETARILALSDRYTALVSARRTRPAMTAREGLKLLYMGQDSDCGAVLTQTFIRALGIYPPGSFVVLTNGEVGVVSHRGRDAMRPIVASLLSPNKTPYPRPFRRDTSQGEYRIVSGYRSDGSLIVNPSLIWTV